jgi:hypothetical protein
MKDIKYGPGNNNYGRDKSIDDLLKGKVSKPKTELEILKEVKSLFDYYSNGSDISVGYSQLCSKIKQLESPLPRPVEDGKPYWVIERKCDSGFEYYDYFTNEWFNDIHKATKRNTDAEIMHLYVRVKFKPELKEAYISEHMDVSEGKKEERKTSLEIADAFIAETSKEELAQLIKLASDRFDSLFEQPSQSDMDIVAKFPEQKTIKAKLVYEQPEQSKTPEQRLAWLSSRISLDAVAKDYILAQFIDIKAEAIQSSLREVKLPDKDKAKLKSRETPTHDFWNIWMQGFDYYEKELKRLNNLK